MTQERRLGMGLEALMGTEGTGAEATPQTPETVPSTPERTEPAAKEQPTGAPRELSVRVIEPNPYQPRQTFDETELDNLAASIRQNGLIQPIMVRRHNGNYQLIAGERRLKASQRAGLRTIPVFIKNVPDEEMLALALVENIQRKDLDPIEKARAFRQLMDLRGWTQEQAAESLGLARPTVANFLRLLDLPHEIREAVSSGAITMGHARALAGLSNRAQIIRLLRQIVSKELSVRALERVVTAENRPARHKAKSQRKEAFIQDLEERLTRKLGTKTELRPKGNSGEIVVKYYSTEQLNGILKQLGL